MTDVAGHITSTKTSHDTESWMKFLAAPVCAEEACLSSSQADGTPIRGHVWYNSGAFHNDAFKPHLRKYCHTCAFWYRALENADAGTVVIQSSTKHAGVHPLIHPEEYTKWYYRFDPENPIGDCAKKFLGYSGRLWRIHFLDGREKDFVDTNDLWYQGEIPTWLAHLFTVNAELL